MRWYEAILVVAVALWIHDRIKSARAAPGGTDTDLATPAELEEGRSETMLGALEQASAMDPDNAEIHASRARTLCEVGRHADALDALELARRLDPALDVSAVRGMALLGLGRAGDALVELERAVEADAGDAGAHADLGRALREVGRHAEALESFDRAISIDPDDASFHVHRGYALESMGRLSDSLTAFHRATRMDPAMSRLVPQP